MDVELEHGVHDVQTNVTDDDPLVTSIDLYWLPLGAGGHSSA